MSVSLTTLAKDIIPSLPVLVKDARSVCEDRTYETPALAHEALKGLYGRLRASGVLCSSYPILKIAGKMSELQAEMNRADAVNSISLTENTIERMKKAASDFAKVSTAAEGEAEIPDVVEQKEICKENLERRIASLEKLVIEAKALMTDEKPEVPSASEETPEAPPAKKPKIDHALEKGTLGDHLLLIKINEAYARFCSILASGEDQWFTLKGNAELPGASPMSLTLKRKYADPDWLSVIEKVMDELCNLASAAHCCCRVSPVEERINEIGFNFL